MMRIFPRQQESPVSALVEGGEDRAATGGVVGACDRCSRRGRI